MISAQVKRRQLIRKWPEKLNDVNKSFLPQAIEIVEQEAIRRVPVDSGTLRASIKQRVKKDSATVGTAENYAPHVEYGTVKMKAQPFLRPALLNNKTNIMRLWRRIFRSVYGR